MVVHEVVGTQYAQHVPGSASQLFWWRGLRIAGQGKLGLSDIKATLLQASRTAVGMSKAQNRIHSSAAQRLGVTNVKAQGCTSSHAHTVPT